jgi:hypothetical protein
MRLIMDVFNNAIADEMSKFAANVVAEAIEHGAPALKGAFLKFSKTLQGKGLSNEEIVRISSLKGPKVRQAAADEALSKLKPAGGGANPTLQPDVSAEGNKLLAGPVDAEALAVVAGRKPPVLRPWGNRRGYGPSANASASANVTINTPIPPTRSPRKKPTAEDLAATAKRKEDTTRYLELGRKTEAERLAAERLAASGGGVNNQITNQNNMSGGFNRQGGGLMDDESTRNLMLGAGGLAAFSIANR